MGAAADDDQPLLAGDEESHVIAKFVTHGVLSNAGGISRAQHEARIAGFKVSRAWHRPGQPDALAQFERFAHPLPVGAKRGQ